jgi:predicted DNA-binding protein
VAGRAADVEMPDEMKRRLRAFLSERTGGTEP